MLTTHPVQNLARETVTVCTAAHPDASGAFRLVQERQLRLAACDLPWRLADQPAERAGEVRLIEVAGVVRDVGDRVTARSRSVACRARSIGAWRRG